ncbi:GtrA family protein [Haloplasma contractile]|uniref:GtrA-like protein n=1 Tax=Haloplasma contractile SSD-17B TaxID=1033810 RepID=U2DUE8_9MOLU|nr:GtrA family protein [Haloplasma contractile]ERJ12022.1 GtrA-like protein [Haloplasma contractile SSD-17B]
MKLIHNFIVKLDIKEFLRFVMVGVLATGINYIVYYTLQRSGVNINISYTAGFVVSFIFNYFASNLFTFKTKPNLKRGLSFGVAHVINFLTQLALLNLFVLIGLSKTLAPLPVYMISVPLNFLFVRYALKRK